MANREEIDLIVSHLEYASAGERTKAIFDNAQMLGKKDKVICNLVC